MSTDIITRLNLLAGKIKADPVYQAIGNGDIHYPKFDVTCKMKLKESGEFLPISTIARGCPSTREGRIKASTEMYGKVMDYMGGKQTSSSIDVTSSLMPVKPIASASSKFNTSMHEFPVLKHEPIDRALSASNNQFSPMNYNNNSTINNAPRTVDQINNNSFKSNVKPISTDEIVIGRSFIRTVDPNINRLIDYIARHGCSVEIGMSVKDLALELKTDFAILYNLLSNTVNPMESVIKLLNPELFVEDNNPDLQVRFDCRENLNELNKYCYDTTMDNYSRSLVPDEDSDSEFSSGEDIADNINIEFNSSGNFASAYLKDLPTTPTVSVNITCDSTLYSGMLVRQDGNLAEKEYLKVKEWFLNLRKKHKTLNNNSTLSSNGNFQ